VKAVGPQSHIYYARFTRGRCGAVRSASQCDAFIGPVRLRPSRLVLRS